MPNYYDPLQGNPLLVFIRYAIPSVIGLLAASSASLVDAIFLGNYVGAEALAAVNITVPATSFLFAMVFMLAIGGSVIAGKHLGEGKVLAASDIFTKTMTVAIAVSLIIAIPSLIFLDTLVLLLGSSETLSPLVTQYLRIILLFSPTLVVGITLYYFIIVDGHPILASISLIGSAIINILLDWILIVIFDQGIWGAALSTGLSELFVMIIMLPYLFNKQSKLKLIRLRGQWHVTLQAAINGSSEFINEMSVGMTTLLFNWIIITRLGTPGVAAFTIVQYLLFIAIMICYGFAESLQPLISQNMGAKKPERIMAFLKTAMLSSFVVGLVISVILLIIPGTLISFFLHKGEAETVAIAMTMIALFWPAFLFNGMNITLTSYFTSLHKPIPSASISLLRSLVFPAILLLSLPIWLDNIGIYISIPIAELLTFFVAIILVKKIPLPLNKST